MLRRDIALVYLVLPLQAYEGGINQDQGLNARPELVGSDRGSHPSHGVPGQDRKLNLQRLDESDYIASQVAVQVAAFGSARPTMPPRVGQNHIERILQPMRQRQQTSATTHQSVER